MLTLPYLELHPPQTTGLFFLAPYCEGIIPVSTRPTHPQPSHEWPQCPQAAPETLGKGGKKKRQKSRRTGYNDPFTLSSRDYFTSTPSSSSFSRLKNKYRREKSRGNDSLMLPHKNPVASLPVVFLPWPGQSPNSRLQTPNSKLQTPFSSQGDYYGEMFSLPHSRLPWNSSYEAPLEASPHSQKFWVPPGHGQSLG